MRKHTWIALLALALAFVSAPAFAQASNSTSLSGVVVDNTGGVMPGVTVVIKNNATNVTTQTVTNASGAYSFAALDPGTYTLTISLQGFKTLEDKALRLLAASPVNLKHTLEVGGMSEKVEISASTELVRTQNATVTNTVNTELISSLPRGDRNALSYLIFLPGVNTPGGSQNSRSSTVEGLPANAINITIDGITTGNSLMTSDPFFSIVTPRLDSVEEVQMTTAAQGADSSGQGTVQIRFVTRSGSNQYQTSIYEYLKHKSLNSNSFFNGTVNKLPIPRATVDQYGGRIGGPIVIPGLFDGHGKAFFFFNQEEIWQPNQTARQRTVALPSTQAGDFTYNAVSPHTVNVLTLAASNGQISKVDPTVAGLFAAINKATATTGNLQASSSNPDVELYNYQVTVASVRHQPTGRVDVNLSTNNKLSGSYYFQRYHDTPDTLNSADPTFPGFPAQAGQNSYRSTGSSTLHTTIGKSMVNEVLVGWQTSPVSFFSDSSPALFSDANVNQNGYYINFGSIGSTLTNVAPGNANFPEVRNTINLNINDSFNWLKGDHSIKAGFEFTRLWNRQDDYQEVPQINLGLSSSGNLNDPALSMFTTGNFPTATSTDLNNARQLYGILTGRVASIPATAYLNEAGSNYIYDGHLLQKERQDEYGGYISDNWRWKPNLTLTYGLRYEVQMPVVALVGLLTGSTMTDACGISGIGAGIGGRQCNLYQPGFVGNSSFTGSYFQPLSVNGAGYVLDKNNWAPDVGVNWRPNVKHGALRAFLGDPEQATVSGGWSRSYDRERFDRFQTVYVGNPGATTPATRGFSSTNFCLVCPGDTEPYVLLSETSRLGAPAFVQTPSFPLLATTGQGIYVFDPHIEVPYTDTWTAGLQRAVSRDMVIEGRYVGNHSYAPWALENWNNVNVEETGLIGSKADPVDGVANQFILAQQNLLANVAAGRGATFAYEGSGTGTSPLPLFLAAFNAKAASAASDSTAYTGTQWTSATWVNALNPFSPSPGSIASNLYSASSGAFFNNMKSVGYPTNYFVMNPSVGSSNVMRNSGYTKYQSLQLDLRRRFSHGLQFDVNYVWAHTRIVNTPTNGSSSDYHLPLLEQLSTGTVPHSIKLIWTWQIPVGRGQRFGANMNRWLDGVVGGWTFSGTGRFQVPLFRLSNTTLVGMTKAQANTYFKQIRVVTDPITGNVTVWDMPQAIINSTIQAYSVSGATAGYYVAGTPTGQYFAPASHPAGFLGPNDPGCMGINAGDCAPDMFFYGKWFGEFDFRIQKQFTLTHRANFQIGFDMFNALNGINFNQNLNPGTSASIFKIGSQGSSARSGQLSFRVNF